VTSVVLAFACALVWGSADYCGGRATVRGGALAVTVVSQLLGLPVLVICVVLLPGRADPPDLVWGAGAGVAGLLGIVALYRGLATGSMSVVAPVTAVTGALIPIAVGLATGERPTVLALAGSGCAVLAIALVSMGSVEPTGLAVKPRSGARVIGLALVAGTLFGLFFSMLAQTNGDAGMWPLVAARTASVSLGLMAAWGMSSLGRRSSLRPTSLRLPRRILGWVAVAGTGDIGANALYLLATHGGLLSVVAPIAALYPVSTVVLAVTVDRERVGVGQLVGLGLAATALVLTAV
jgi:drug/metabolite transporter (DMT)-like permease